MRKCLIRIPLILTVIIMTLIGGCLPLYASQGSGPYTSNDGTVFYMPVADKTRILYDYADLFTDAQEKELTQKLSLESDEKNCEIMVLTSYDIPRDINYGTETTQKYAEEFMHENAISDDRTILIMDMNNRLVVVYGQGRFYGDDKFVKMAEDFYNEIYDDMANANYVHVVERYISYMHRFRNIMFALIPTPGSLAISAVLSAMVLISLIARHKSTQPSKATQIPIKTLNYARTHHNSRFLEASREVIRPEAEASPAMREDRPAEAVTSKTQLAGILPARMCRDIEYKT